MLRLWTFYYLEAKLMFFKSASPNQAIEIEKGQLQNAPMATIPITQNPSPFNAEDLVVREDVF